MKDDKLYAGKLPILALRGLAVFPDQTVHFDVGRAKSVLALEAAMKEDQTLFLVPQKDLLVDDPKLKDLYAVGTVAKVKQVLRPQGENLRILVTGLCRSRRKGTPCAPRHCAGRPITCMGCICRCPSILPRRCICT